MRYQASHASLIANRLVMDPRRWLLDAARRSAAVPAEWARGITPRRAAVVAVLAGVALGAGIAGQTVPAPGYSNAIEISNADTAATSAAVASAASSITQLGRPGATLPDPASAALSDSDVALADVTALQQLQARILTPSAVAAAPADGSDLASLVRQAQTQATLSGAQMSSLPALNNAGVQSAEAEVQAAQAAVAAATRARDASAAAATPAGAADPSVAEAIAGGPVNPAVRDAQTRLSAAEQKLQALEAGPDPALLAAAQKAVATALAATPPAPTAGQLADAQAQIDHAQQEIAAATQASNAPRTVASAADSERAGAISVRQSGGEVAAAPDPVASQSSVVGQAAQQLSDSQANLANAKAALAALQQQAAKAASPESQPAVIAAKNRLAEVQAPPDASAVAQAQQAVNSAQADLTRAEGQATSAAVAATGPGASSAGSSAAAPSSGDAVAAAEQRLAQAQARLRNVVQPSSDLSGDAAALAAASGVPPAGPGIVSSAANALPPLVTVAAADGPLASEAQPGLAALIAGQTPAVQDVALRAEYIADVALLVQHLHPSAFDRPIAAAPASPASIRPSASALMWPVVGPITQPFGVPELGVGAPHTGLDIGVPTGTPVHAAAAGVVSFAGGDPTSGYGYYVIIDHGQGISTLYGHLALSPFLRVGTYLPQNAIVGISGSTGFSTGPHVHFEVRLNSTPLDPQRVLPVLHTLSGGSTP